MRRRQRRIVGRVKQPQLLLEQERAHHRLVGLLDCVEQQASCGHSAPRVLWTVRRGAWWCVADATAMNLTRRRQGCKVAALPSRPTDRGLPRTGAARDRAYASATTTRSLQRPATEQPSVRCYAGIGSRRAPTPILELMRAVAGRLADDGWTLRSGGAPGADQAFQAGAAQAGGAIELYLPWPTFESANLARLGAVTLRLERPAPAAAEIAARWHPAWKELSPAARKPARP